MTYILRKFAAGNPLAIPAQNITGVDAAFDGVAYLTTKTPNEQLLSFLQRHTYRCGVESKGFFEWLVKMSRPDARACRELDALGIKPYRAEPSLEVMTSNSDAACLLQDMFNVLHVVPRNGKREPGNSWDTVYTSERGPRLRRQRVSYQGEHAKSTGEIDHAKIEFRYQGAEALRSIGISRFGNLPTFGHKAYWSKNLILRWPDREHRGRLQLNWLHGERRQRPWLRDVGAFGKWNMDKICGNALYHALAAHLNFDGPNGMRSLQAFIAHDRVGPASAIKNKLYLHDIDVSAIIDRIS